MWMISSVSGKTKESKQNRIQKKKNTNKHRHWKWSNWGKSTALLCCHATVNTGHRWSWFEGPLVQEITWCSGAVKKRSLLVLIMSAIIVVKFCSCGHGCSHSSVELSMPSWSGLMYSDIRRYNFSWLETMCVCVCVCASELVRIHLFAMWSLLHKIALQLEVLLNAIHGNNQYHSTHSKLRTEKESRNKNREVKGGHYICWKRYVLFGVEQLHACKQPKMLFFFLFLYTHTPKVLLVGSHGKAVHQSPSPPPLLFWYICSDGSYSYEGDVSAVKSGGCGPCFSREACLISCLSL